MVTEEDRNRAMLVVAHLPISLGDYRTRDLDAARDVIAAALAAERDKARARFLALADEIDSWEDDTPDGRAAYAHAAQEIRDAAQEVA